MSQSEAWVKEFLQRRATTDPRAAKTLEQLGGVQQTTLERIASKAQEAPKTALGSTLVHSVEEFERAPSNWIKRLEQIALDADEPNPNQYADEEGLQWQICKHLRGLGLWSAVVDSGSKSRTSRAMAGRLPPGFPDIQVIYQGRLVLLEVKRPSGVFTEHQKIEIPRLVKCGAVVHVVHSLREAREAVLGMESVK